MGLTGLDQQLRNEFQKPPHQVELGLSRATWGRREGGRSQRWKQDMEDMGPVVPSGTSHIHAPPQLCRGAAGLEVPPQAGCSPHYFVAL